jgi:hypothetical protein
MLLGCGVTRAQVVYDSLAPSDSNTYYSFDSQGHEMGQEIILGPSTPQTIASFTFQYTDVHFTGSEQVEVYFRQMNGAPDPNGYTSPNSVIYDSGPVSLNPLNSHGLGTITLNNINVTVPTDFTWSVKVIGMASGESAGLAWQRGPGTAPTVGDNYSDYWQYSGSQWQLYSLAPDPNNPDPESFGAQFTAVPEPAATAFVTSAAALLVMVGRRIRRPRS